MLVQQILASKGDLGVITVAPGTTVQEVARLLSSKRIGAVIVSSDGKSARGIVSERDIVRELGCDRINVVSIGQDMARTIGGFGELCEIAAERGIAVSAEMGSLGPLKQVAAAMEVVRGVSQPNFSLVIDSMHFFRLGNTIADLAALDPALIGYVQLADEKDFPHQGKLDFASSEVTATTGTARVRGEFANKDPYAREQPARHGTVFVVRLVKPRPAEVIVHPQPAPAASLSGGKSPASRPHEERVA